MLYTTIQVVLDLDHFDSTKPLVLYYYYYYCRLIDISTEVKDKQTQLKHNGQWIMGRNNLFLPPNDCPL